MILQSKRVIYSRLVMNALLNYLTAITPIGPLFSASPWVFLFGNDFQPTPDTDLADFVPLVFSGNNVAHAGASSPVNQSSTIQTIIMGEIFSSVTAVPQVPGTAFGYFVADSGTPTKWMLAERFATPVQFAVPGDYLFLDVLLPLMTNYELPAG